MSTMTKLSIGTVPAFCTRNRYCSSPPISVPSDVSVKSVSHRASTVLPDTSCAIGATSTELSPVHRMSERSESPSRSLTSVAEVAQR